MCVCVCLCLVELNVKKKEEKDKTMNRISAKEENSIPKKREKIIAVNHYKWMNIFLDENSAKMNPE